MNKLNARQTPFKMIRMDIFNLSPVTLATRSQVWLTVIVTWRSKSSGIRNSILGKFWKFLVSRDFSKFLKVSRGFSKFFEVSRGFSKFLNVSQCFSKFLNVSQSFSRFLEVSRSFSMSPGTPRHLSGCTRLI